MHTYNKSNDSQIILQLVDLVKQSGPLFYILWQISLFERKLGSVPLCLASVKLYFLI